MHIKDGKPWLRKWVSAQGKGTSSLTEQVTGYRPHPSFLSLSLFQQIRPVENGQACHFPHDLCLPGCSACPVTCDHAPLFLAHTASRLFFALFLRSHPSTLQPSPLAHPHSHSHCPRSRSYTHSFPRDLPFPSSHLSYLPLRRNNNEHHRKPLQLFSIRTPSTCKQLLSSTIDLVCCPTGIMLLPFANHSCHRSADCFPPHL